MRLPKRGEKGFTLIELLIVVAILGVLAAVIIPNVGRFLGRGEEEARRTEFHNVSTAVTAMMTDNNISTLPNALAFSEGGTAYNAMTDFPDVTTSSATRVAFLALGETEVLGYRLYGNQIIVDVDGDGVYEAAEGDGVKLANYVTMTQTTYYYTVEADGTIRQFPTATALAADEFKY